MSQFTTTNGYLPKAVALLLAILAAVGIGWLTTTVGLAVPALMVALAVVIPFAIAVLYEPRYGLIAFIAFGFIIQILIREIGGFPYGTLGEALLLLTWVAVITSSPGKYNWSNTKNDLFYLTVFWFVINLLEILNPADASFMGWLQEVRGTSLVWFLTVPLGLILFTRVKDLNLFLVIIIGMSILAALNGLKQLYISPFPGEQAFLNGPAAKTHILFGKLRVFSFYSDAGNFGASQAHMALIAMILALGPFKLWKRILLGVAAALLFYGMLISGTRGALFVVVVGIFVALFISRNFKFILIGTVFALFGLFALKYTTVGSSNYHVQRLRSALNPEDPSLNVRLRNQEILRDYLKTRPLGGGLGVIGFWGEKYNSGKFLATIPPDSYWVKVWAMYGIIGFIIWFGIMMYILGKCCGIVWKIRDKGLRFKLMALTAGTAGILFASYGNEIINSMPSSVIVYISWCFVFLGPKFDRKTPTPALAETTYA